MEFIAYAFVYMIGIFTGTALKNWLITSEARKEIEKALDSTGIRRSEFQALLKKVESNGARIDKLSQLM